MSIINLNKPIKPVLRMYIRNTGFYVCSEVLHNIIRILLLVRLNYNYQNTTVYLTEGYLMKKNLTDAEIKALKFRGILLGEKIGGGSSCDVYEIEPYMGQRGLCVKFMRNPHKKDVEAEYERYRQLYKTEPGRFLKVVNLLWFDLPDEDDPERTYYCAAMVMEKLSRVTEANLTMAMIIKLLFDCAVCLGYMHIIGILHRDVKIENCLYSERTGTFILLDYGISAFGRDTFTERSCKGTPNNIAPGPLRGDYSRRDDFFSLGRMIRKIIVGPEIGYPSESELNGRSLFDYWYDQIAALKPLEEDEYGNPELICIVNKLTMFDRNDRYQTYEELINDIQKLIVSQNINVGRLSQLPHEMCLVFAPKKEISGIKKKNIRNVAKDFFIEHHITNAAVKIIPFSDTVYTRSLSGSHGASKEIMVADENTDFFLSLLKEVKKLNSGTTCLNTYIHICIFGAKDFRRGICAALGDLKKTVRPTNNPVVAYRLTVSDEYAIDVSNIGISEIAIAESSDDFRKCLKNWFGGSKEAIA